MMNYCQDDWKQPATHGALSAAHNTAIHNIAVWSFSFAVCLKYPPIHGVQGESCGDCFVSHEEYVQNRYYTGTILSRRESM